MRKSQKIFTDPTKENYPEKLWENSRWLQVSQEYKSERKFLPKHFVARGKAMDQ
jgi:hypothetical protein